MNEFETLNSDSGSHKSKLSAEMERDFPQFLSLRGINPHLLDFLSSLINQSLEKKFFSHILLTYRLEISINFQGPF